MKIQPIKTEYKRFEKVIEPKPLPKPVIIINNGFPEHKHSKLNKWVEREPYSTCY